MEKDDPSPELPDSNVSASFLVADSYCGHLCPKELPKTSSLAADTPQVVDDSDPIWEDSSR